MTEVLTTFLQFTASYVGVMFLIFFILNFLTKGFVGTFLLVKMSKGKKTLAIIHSATDIYFRAGLWKESFYTFKDRGKDKKSIPIADVEFKRFVKHLLGVSAVEIDEVANKLVDTDFNVVQMVNVDPARLNSLIMRIKNRPVEMSAKEQLIMLMRIATFLGVVFILIKIIGIEKTLSTLKQLSGNI